MNKSQKPYLVRAIWEWCNDQAMTPHILVFVTDIVKVPAKYVVEQQIVLDISSDATSQLNMTNDWISFEASFGSNVEKIEIPMVSVIAAFSAETSEGMFFDPPEADDLKNVLDIKMGAGEDDDLDLPNVDAKKDAKKALDAKLKKSTLKVIK